MKRRRDLVRTLSCLRCFFSLPKKNPNTTKRKRAMEDSSSSSSSSERYCYNPILRWNPQVEDYFIKAYGSDHFSRISKALTRPSCYSCIRVNTLKSTSDAVIQKLLTIIKEEEGEGASESESEIGRISKCQFPGLEDYVVFYRGSGPHVIDYATPPKEIIVSRKCAEAVLRGAQVYVPGVIACSAHVEKGDAVAVSVGVEQPALDGGGWGIGITRGTVLLGLKTDPYYFERNGLYIGQGTAMMSRAGMFRVSEGIAVDMSNRVFKLPSFHDVLEGEIFLQNLPSIVTAHALDPQKGERILDMCAAPGGKTTAIAMLLKDEGEVVAVDRSHNKVLDIQKLAAEMGLNCITAFKLDALKAVWRRNDSDITTDLCCSEEIDGVTIQSSDLLGSHVERNSSIIMEGMSAEKSGKESAMKKRLRELMLAKLTSGRIYEEYGMALDEISAMVVGFRIRKVFLLTALIESFLMLPALPLV